ncbi:MAG: Smr/MutS family protein [Bacilli bacterium]|nr:Smr/MutS family protein [Bacilli bacterium]
MIFDDIFINNLPTLDLHGEIKDSARVLIKEFIYDNYVMKNKKVVIIHGIGKGKIKEEVINNLKNNKMVLSFHLNRYNSGCTVVYIKDKK